MNASFVTLTTHELTNLTTPSPAGGTKLKKPMWHWDDATHKWVARTDIPTAVLPRHEYMRLLNKQNSSSSKVRKFKRVWNHPEHKWEQKWDTDKF